MYEYDGHTTVRPMLIHTNDAELRWNIVHDVGPRTQCAQLVIRCLEDNPWGSKWLQFPSPTVSGSIRTVRRLGHVQGGVWPGAAGGAGLCSTTNPSWAAGPA